MKPLRFYEHFACAYGTIWLVTLGFAVLTQQHIDTGAFGLFGFPVIALIYAFLRRSTDNQEFYEMERLRGELNDLRRRDREGKW